VTIRRKNHGRGHSYTIDGERADGVTTLLGDGLAKPALINWAAKTTANYAVDNWSDLADLPTSQRLDRLMRARFDDLDAAARRGTEVHRLGEALVQGEEIEVPEALAGHVESYVHFLDEWEPEPVLVETVVGHRRWRYCGTTDLIADMRGERWLLDLKTARSGIYPEVALQLAAYRWAEVYLDGNGDEQPMDELGVDRAAAVHVRADGYDVIPLRSDEAVFRAFQHVAWIARMQKQWEDWRGEALPASTRQVAS
jgi:hypothetical protein